MKTKPMKTKIPPAKEVLIQFRVPEGVAYGLRVVAAKEKFSTLSRYLKSVCEKIADRA
jgi:hypothetical protein